MDSQSATLSDRTPSSPSRMTVVHQGALGDFVLSLPVFDGLYDIRRNLRIDFCSKSEQAALVRTKPYVGNLYSSDGSELTPFFHEDLWKQTPLPEFLENSNVVFIFGQTSSRALSERLSQRLSAQVQWVKSFPDAGYTRPVSLFLVEQIRSLGWPIEDAFPKIDPHEDDRESVREWMRQRGFSENLRPVVIHPGSGGKKKIWPLKNWWALLKWLCHEQRKPVVMPLGPADECLRAFASEAQKLGVALLEHIPLTRLAAFLSESLFYIGNDSGVTHLAAAVGIPTVAVFGPTSPEVWAPLGPHVHVIRNSWENDEIFSWSPQTESAIEPQLRELLMSLITHHPRTVLASDACYEGLPYRNP